MNCQFLPSFARDLKKIRNPPILERVRAAIESVERAANPAAVRHLEMLSGAQDCYRIRVGNYRIGLTIAADTVTFVRCLHRREIYRYFP